MIFQLYQLRHFWALSVIWEVWNIWNINRTKIFLIKMRGVSSFYDQRIARDRFWVLLTHFGPFWPYLGIFEHFRLSDRYEIYETLIELIELINWTILNMVKIELRSSWLKWGVCQVSTTNGSQEIDFGSFWPILVPFDPIWGFLSTSGYLTGMKCMKHW